MALPFNFVDTSGWFDLFTDDNPQQAEQVSKIWKSKKYQFITSDFVVDELLTLMRSRGYDDMTGRAWNTITTSAKRLSLSHDDVDETFRLFQKFDDHDWSFTDCSSYLLIKRHAIPFACAFNGHFKEFGIVAVLP